ncbi:MAG: hypothetical protein U5K30_13655 [Acidimicrobiales bacterium]|nr:hypothetical protein [Acidimicrobiales bacterium]
MPSDKATRVLKPLARLVRGRGRMVGAAVAATAAATAIAVTQRRRHDTLVLPDPGPMAAETAISVHNAAKSSVIAMIREADAPDRNLVDGAIRDAVIESSGSGADVLAAAIGAVEGSFEIAHLVGEKPHELVPSSAAAAVDAAALQGPTAANRVRDVLGDHLAD